MLGLKLNHVSKRGHWWSGTHLFYLFYLRAPVMKWLQWIDWKLGHRFCSPSDGRYGRMLTWINFDPSMGKWSHTQESVGWHNFSILKLQRLRRWSLGMDKLFHPTVYNNGCSYLSMLGLKVIHVSKRDHWCLYIYIYICMYIYVYQSVTLCLFSKR